MVDEGKNLECPVDVRPFFRAGRDGNSLPDLCPSAPSVKGTVDSKYIHFLPTKSSTWRISRTPGQEHNENLRYNLKQNNEI